MSRFYQHLCRQEAERILNFARPTLHSLATPSSVITSKYIFKVLVYNISTSLHRIRRNYLSSGLYPIRFHFIIFSK